MILPLLTPEYLSTSYQVCGLNPRTLLAWVRKSQEEQGRKRFALRF